MKKESAVRLKNGISQAFVIILVVCVSIYSVGSIVNIFLNMGTRSKTDELIAELGTLAEADICRPYVAEDGNWTFSTDEELKILQISDVHVGGGWMCFLRDREAIENVCRMISIEQPDLVIFTGDTAHAVPFQAGAINNLNAFKLVAEAVDKLGVSWTVVFGEHDSEPYSFNTRETISNYLESDDLTNCIFKVGPSEVDGYGNQIINIVNSQGLVTKSLVLFDSHSYSENNKIGLNWKYDNIHANQLEWFENQIAAVNAANLAKLTAQGADLTLPENDRYLNVQSLAFFHIPLYEYKMAIDELLANDMQSTANVTLLYGDVGEPSPYVYCGVNIDDGVFECLKANNTTNIFVGHDHYNYLTMCYQGVYLTYGMSIDYVAYGNQMDELTEQRGCTRIMLNVDGSVEVTAHNYLEDYPLADDGGNLLEDLIEG